MVPIKIYPSKHKIKIINESTFDTDLNIPLSYVNLDYTKYDLVKSIEPDFLKYDANKNISMTPIIPKQLIDDPGRYVFNKFEERVDIKPVCKEIQNKNYFTPPHEFIPYNFKYEMIVKKNMTYNSGKKYNINVACYDDADSLDLSSRMAQIFVKPTNDNTEKWSLTDNISFNYDKLSASSFTEMSFEEADFLFLETYDGQYLDADKTEMINVSNFLDENINVWVGCDTHHYYKHKNDELGYETFNNIGAFKEFELKRSLLSTNRKILSDVYFNLNRSEYLNQTGKNLYNIFTSELSPVLIVEHIGKGFEIISHNDVLKNPQKHKNLIYEVMMYVYLITYKKSKLMNEWISYTVPDYEVINNKLCTKSNFSSHKTLNDILPDLSFSDYNVYQINIFDNNNGDIPVSEDDLVDSAFIDCIDIANNRLVFKMVDNGSTAYTEIKKPVGWVSIYHDNKIYYIDRIYYYIESDITDKLFVIEKDNSLIVKLYPFKSSKYNINLTVDLETEIKDIKTMNNGTLRVVNEIYYLYLDTNDLSLHSEIDSEYVQQANFVKIAEIDIHQSVDNTFLTDMRQLGGGLSKEAQDDYDLLDIGHINGRPYRKSNTLIITMPTKYEPYKDRILAALEKYKVGEDYPVLYFEDDKE